VWPISSENKKYKFARRFPNMCSEVFLSKEERNNVGRKEHVASSTVAKSLELHVSGCVIVIVILASFL